MARKLDNWIKEFMLYSAQSEAPDQFHFWTAVSCIAGALRRKVWIDMGYFEWTPNFYIVFVAPPGIVSKSTTASIGMNLLKQVTGIKFGPDAVTWQSLVQSLAESTEGFPYPDEATLNPMSAITIVSSEFGNFLNPQDREMVDVLVSLWDGQRGTFRKATKTQGDDSIENPWINIIACTTPDWIAGNFPEYMIGGGFTSRTIFVYGEEKRQLRAYPADYLPDNFKEHGAALIEGLQHIADNCVGEYLLSPEAKVWGERWYKNHYEKRPAHLADDKFGGYVARKQTHMHKLAIVIAASQRDSLVIEMEDLIMAESMVTSTEIDMPKVFAKISGSDARFASQLLGIIGKHKAITTTAAFQLMFSSCTYDQFSDAVKAMTQAGYITVKQVGTEMKLCPTPQLEARFVVKAEDIIYGASDAATG